ncbi:MAG: S8 family serine peptidase [Candidatus Aenigmarchaeota archaeon]|nr:S8 family serine peptidase [Candidatus Aenigmarchaeota archaeon]
MVQSEEVTGEGVVVAVLDSGIDTDHQEFVDDHIDGMSFVDYITSYEDDAGHGTHVSGIITSPGINSDAIGVSPDVDIWMAKVCDSSGSCYVSDMIAAIEYIIRHGIADIMSISIGGGGTTAENCDTDMLAAKVNDAVSSGITVVVSAGNDGKVVSSPACASGAIAVGAVDSSDNVVWWSGRGKALDIVAPGVDIYSSVPGSYDHYSGTSMACPHVSGTVALLRSVNPSLTDAEIKNALYTTATPVNKCYNGKITGPFVRTEEVQCTSEITGAGVVDAYGTYQAVVPQEPECSFDSDCDDGLWCNGAETCDSNGFCQPGTVVDCSSYGDQCNEGVCDETNDVCTSQPVMDGTSCEDGSFCTSGDYCSSGVCQSGTEPTCDDNEACTIDTCDEAADTCTYTWPECGLADGCCGTSCDSTNDPDCDSCGNGVCESGEDCNACPSDCESRGPHCCGDGVCSGPESGYCIVDCN